MKQNQKETGPFAEAQLTMVSLFSGAGGLDLGLEASGLHTLFASDFDLHSCQTLNMGKRYSQKNDLPFLRSADIECCDVSEIRGRDVLQRIGLERGELALMAGGPPCQAFSVMGRRHGRLDPRGKLPEEYVRLLGELAPRAFVFENVFGLLTVEGGAVFEAICEMLKAPSPDLNYTLSVFRLNAADYGVPQKRDRVFIIGSREGLEITEIPKITSYSSSAGVLPRTVSDALRGLPPIGSGLANHVGRQHSQRIIDRYGALSFGERDPKTRINKLNPIEPSFTIIVGSDKGGGKGHVHPFEAREVTPRESARIQTFPDWWEFSGTSRHPIRQVGNAVPPLLAACIGKEIVEKLLGGTSPEFFEMVELLGQQHLFAKAVTSK
jgi:DNA (cytosine-5)-methyltransferase 1